MSEQVNPIEHKVQLPDGTFANTVGPEDVVLQMYPGAFSDERTILMGEPRADANGVTVLPFNGVLRFKEQLDGKIAIQGNTVTRGCAVAANCGSCALAGEGLTVTEMADKNCARANTATTYDYMRTDPRSRFVLLPTGKDAYVVDSDSFTPEYNGSTLMQNRLKASPAVVFTESWLQEQELSDFAPSMNGADGSMGVMTGELAGDTIYVPFCSMRQNMGDRDEADQILRQALHAYLDSKAIEGDDRTQALASFRPAITLSASASLRYFAHQIQVPAEGSDAANRLREKYPDLVKRAGGKITSAIVLNDQYPGAFERKSIFPQFEAEMGIHKTPITPDKCPGDGQTCHIDYRIETEYALTKQLKDMGISEVSISYDESQALDPASPDNNMATNRREQNNGVAVANTNRTLNAMIVFVDSQLEVRAKIDQLVRLQSGRNFAVRTFGELSEGDVDTFTRSFDEGAVKLQRLYNVLFNMTKQGGPDGKPYRARHNIFE